MKIMEMLEIGDTVEVFATVTFSVSHRDTKVLSRKAWRSKFQGKAQIVGATRRRYEVIHPARGPTLEFEEYEQAYLQIEGTVFVYLIRTVLMRKQLEALPYDLQRVVWPHT